VGGDVHPIIRIGRLSIVVVYTHETGEGIVNVAITDNAAF
jgi:hypothetical protein